MLYLVILINLFVLCSCSCYCNAAVLHVEVVHFELIVIVIPVLKLLRASYPASYLIDFHKKSVQIGQLWASVKIGMLNICKLWTFLGLRNPVLKFCFKQASAAFL